MYPPPTFITCHHTPPVSPTHLRPHLVFSPHHHPLWPGLESQPCCLSAPWSGASHFPGVVRDPKTTLRFNGDSQNSAKPLYSRLQFITVKGCRVQSAKGHMGWSPGETSGLSQWRYTDSAYSSRQQCVTTCTEYCPPGKLTQASSPGFFFGFGHVDMTAWVADLSLQPLWRSSPKPPL